MNRVIKFRGKRIDNGEWIYGSLIEDKYIVGKVVDWEEDYFNTEFWWKVIPETVGQFTGLLDKNGKEIYEGDIVNLFYENDDDVYIIEWHNYTSRFEINSKTLSVDFDNYYSYELEVIGNIHDNQKLLEVQ